MKRSTLIPRRSPESRAQPRPVTPLTIRQATDPLFDRASILLLAKRIQKIRNRALAWERRFSGDLEKANPGFRPSARNLLHYLALRQEDLRELQHELTLRGLTSLGRCDAELQEDILWICEAAHIPVIWATQVLEGLAKKGLPSRAEVTDAAMSGRAECVMLNKGPHILAAMRFLNNVLLRMQQHQYKKRDLLRRLEVSLG